MRGENPLWEESEKRSARHHEFRRIYKWLRK